MLQGVRNDLRGAVTGWRNDWPLMSARLIVSALLGQGIFWRFGYDQLSIGGKQARIMQTGYGRALGRWVYARLSHNRPTLYGVKAVEIVADLGRCATEGRIYRRYGLAPDVVACTVTQPAWSLIEGAEKLVSLLLNLKAYEEVGEEEFVVALSCIYGSLFRYGQAGLILLLGDHINKRLTQPLARQIRRAGPVVPVLAATGATIVTARTIRGYLSRRP